MFRAAKRALERHAPFIAAALATAGRHVPQSTMSTLLLHAGSKPSTSAAALAGLTVASECGDVGVVCLQQFGAQLIMIKPDGVQRGLVGDIIKRFEQRGYKLVGIKVLVPSRELASKHYAEHEGRPFFPKLVDFLSSGAVVAMVFEGKDVVKTGRSMIGATNPLASPPGTIRADYALDVGRNIIHGSDSVESAMRECALWFRPDELADFGLVSAAWIYE